MCPSRMWYSCLLRKVLCLLRKFVLNLRLLHRLQSKLRDCSPRWHRWWTLLRILVPKCFLHVFSPDRKKDDVWYCANDSRVTEVSLEEVLGCTQAYMLFYSKSNSPPSQNAKRRSLESSSLRRSQFSNFFLRDFFEESQYELVSSRNNLASSRRIFGFLRDSYSGLQEEPQSLDSQLIKFQPLSSQSPSPSDFLGEM